MKKILLLLTAIVLMAMTGQAQESIKLRAKKSFLTLNAGPAFPVGDFASTSSNNDNAGFARTGYNINLHYFYNIQNNVGITANAFYSQFLLDKTLLHDIPGAIIDHWQYYGIAAGPAFYTNAGGNLYFDLRVSGGIANVNSPRILYQGETVMSEDWSAAAMIQGGADARILFGKNMFLFTNVDYTYMKPTFNVPSILSSEPEKVKQDITALSLSLGIGLNF